MLDEADRLLDLGFEERCVCVCVYVCVTYLANNSINTILSYLPKQRRTVRYGRVKVHLDINLLSVEGFVLCYSQRGGKDADESWPQGPCGHHSEREAGPQGTNVCHLATKQLTHLSCACAGTRHPPHLSRSRTSMW